VRQFMSRMGAGNAAITHPTTTLEDLFIRIVRENTPMNDAYSGGAERARPAGGFPVASASSTSSPSSSNGNNA
jgi:hypothetical protein